MKVLIVTVAGTSSRFGNSVGKPCLKCIYSPAGTKSSLLYKIIHQPVDIDKYVVVGGYMYDVLEKTLESEFSQYKDKIILVKNEKYMEYGSGYSLYKGIEAVINTDFDEIVFAEGDLFIDTETFVNVCNSHKSIITCNNEDILADKAVAFYFDMNNKIRYIYDTGHNALKIDEPFLSIFNSGQIWKFAKAKYMRKVYEEMKEKDWQDTNLVFIEKYFRGLDSDKYEILKFRHWINCNTIQDFEKIDHLEEKIENEK